MPKQPKPYKILYPFHGDSVGGSHMSTATFISCMDQSIFQPHVALHENSEKQKTLLQSRDIPFEVLYGIYVPGSFKDLILNPFRCLRSVFKAKKYLKDKAIDLVHCDNSPLRYIWFYAALLAGVPYVHVQRTLMQTCNAEKRWSYARVSAIVSNSKTTQATLPSVSEKIVQDVCYPIIQVDTSGRDKVKDRKLCLSFFDDVKPDVHVVGFLGNMQGCKRPEVFIEMAGGLNAEYPGQFKFIMVGGFYQDPEPIKDMVRDYGLEKTLVFAGFQSDPYAFLNGFDVLVAPALREAFGRNLVEAFALQTPVVAADHGGHQEIIVNGENGFLVEPDDAKSFAEHVLKLCDREFSETITRHASRSLERFKPEPIAAQFEEVYRKVLKN